MSGEGVHPLNGRDRAVLRAIGAGRCQLGAGCEPVLLVDGLLCADLGVGARLVADGLIRPPDAARPLGPARLTRAGVEALRSTLV